MGRMPTYIELVLSRELDRMTAEYILHVDLNGMSRSLIVLYSKADICLDLTEVDTVLYLKDVDR